MPPAPPPTARPRPARPTSRPAPGGGRGGGAGPHRCATAPPRPGRARPGGGRPPCPPPGQDGHRRRQERRDRPVAVVEVPGLLPKPVGPGLGDGRTPDEVVHLPAPGRHHEAEDERRRDAGRQGGARGVEGVDVEEARHLGGDGPADPREHTAHEGDGGGAGVRALPEDADPEHGDHGGRRDGQDRPQVLPQRRGSPGSGASRSPRSPAPSRRRPRRRAAGPTRRARAVARGPSTRPSR